MLLQNWLRVTAGWRAAFPRQRSFRRAVGQALRHTVHGVHV